MSRLVNKQTGYLFFGIEHYKVGTDGFVGNPTQPPLRGGVPNDSWLGQIFLIRENAPKQGQTWTSVPIGLYLFLPKRASLYTKERLSSQQGNALFKWRRAFLCFVFIVSVFRSIASLHTNPASSNSLPLGTSPPLEGLGEALNEALLPYWNIMCIFVMFVL